MIASSFRMLRERGLLDHYRRLVDPFLRDQLEAVVAGTWVPVRLIVAHYTACDQLGFTVAELIELGRGMTSRLHQPVLKVAIGLAGAAGVTPWALVPQLGKIWERLHRGGAVRITPLGPKEARFDILGFQCATIPYCRIAWRGVLLGGVELLTPRAYVNEIPAGCGSTSLGYRISWV